jgi:hypothetical protein
MSIKVREVSGLELYLQYPGEQNPQPCYVQFDPRSEELLAAADGEIGPGQPMAVWYGLVLRWRILPLREEAANVLLAKVAPLAEQLAAGFSTRWDGNSTVGVYTADATKAGETIGRLCSEADGGIVAIAAADFLAGLGCDATQARELGIASTSTDAELDGIATELLDGAEGVDIIVGLDKHLARLRARVVSGTRPQVRDVVGSIGAIPDTIEPSPLRIQAGVARITRIV